MSLFSGGFTKIIATAPWSAAFFTFVLRCADSDQSPPGLNRLLPFLSAGSNRQATTTFPFRAGSWRGERSASPMKIAFIGLGNMGNPMGRNLLKHGHALRVHDLVPELVRKLASEDRAEASGSIGECVQAVDMVVTMLPSSPHVRTAYLASDGILANVSAGTPEPKV